VIEVAHVDRRLFPGAASLQRELEEPRIGFLDGFLVGIEQAVDAA
jgi:hypothetical protein